MKKKLLSLVLAGAMVASTSVSAFATTQKIEGADSADGQADIKITGQVESDLGELPVGRFNVTIPTTASFTITQDGKFITPGEISVQNAGEQNIEVYAYRFTDSTPVDKKGITAVGKQNLSGYNRTGVNLSIKGNGRKAYLGSVDDESKSGIYSDENLAKEAAAEGVKIATVSKMSSQNLTLEGEVGTKSKQESDGAVAQAVNDTFTLTLKIKKSADQ